MNEPIHGTRSRYKAGCRCDDCRKANARAQKEYRHRARCYTSDGTPEIPQRVPAEPVVEHIEKLIASGWLKKDIATDAGTKASTISGIARRKWPKMARHIANAILALEPLEPVAVDPVVVERLVAGKDWRAENATHAERVAAARLLTPGQWDRLGLNRRAMERAS
jgi:hypothetical protein